MKRKLYPRMDEEMGHLSGRVQTCVLDRVESIARREVRTRSDVIRMLLIEALRARGEVASEAELADATA